MSLSKDQVVERLRRVKGPDLQGNIVDLGLVSEILLKDGRVSFSITVPPERAGELEPLRQAAEKVVREIEGVHGRGRRPDRREAARGARRPALGARHPCRTGAGKRQGAGSACPKPAAAAPPLPPRLLPPPRPQAISRTSPASST